MDTWGFSGTLDPFERLSEVRLRGVLTYAAAPSLPD